MSRNDNIVEHNFKYLEFVDLVKNNKQAPARSSYNKSDTWHGTGTFKEAIELAEKGWESGIKQLDINDGTLIGSGCNFNQNVYGSVVNIGAYLKGLPENMWELSEEREFNLEPLTIYIPLSMLAKNSVKKAMDFTQANVNYVNRMQSNYNVRVIGVFESTYHNNGGFIGVENIVIKDFDERLILNSIAFAFHPSFFRRLQFRLCEILSRGYGGSHSTEKILNRLRTTEMTGDKSVMIPSLNSLDTGKFQDSEVERVNFQGTLNGEIYELA